MPTEIQLRYKTSIFAQFTFQWLVRDICIKHKGWISVFVFPQMLYGYSVLNLFDICGLYFYPQILDRCYTDVFCLKSVDFLFFSGCQTNPLLSTPLHSLPGEGWWPRGEDGERRNSSGGNREQNPLCIPFRLNKTLHGCSLHHCRRR